MWRAFMYVIMKLRDQKCTGIILTICEYVGFSRNIMLRRVSSINKQMFVNTALISDDLFTIFL
jgi:hypothetical protein